MLDLSLAKWRYLFLFWAGFFFFFLFFTQGLFFLFLIFPLRALRVISVKSFHVEILSSK